MTVIRPDEIFLLNGAADYVILLLTARISGAAVKRRRLAAGAALGGAYAVVSAVGDGWLIHPAVKLAAGTAVCLAAFGGRRELLKLTLIAFALSAAFAGAVMAASALAGADGTGPFPVSLRVMAAAFAVSWGVFAAVFRSQVRHRVNSELRELEITHRGRRSRMTALMDTGNGLRDPLTGETVVICAAGQLEGLFPAETAPLLRLPPQEAMIRLGGGETAFRLIPYRGVGGAGGLLLAFRPDGVSIGGESVKALIAVGDDGICGDGYGAVAGT